MRLRNFGNSREFATYSYVKRSIFNSLTLTLGLPVYAICASAGSHTARNSQETLDAEDYKGSERRGGLYAERSNGGGKYRRVGDTVQRKRTVAASSWIQRT